MKKITPLLLLMLLASCNTVKTYYQVYKTQSQTVKSEGNTIAFEDANCKINYNLWAESGNAGFTFYNKTTEVIYLQLDQSFYVINDRAYDYYQNRIFINTDHLATKTSNTVGFSQLGWLSLASYSTNTLSSNKTSGVETIEAKVVAIPPKTSKTISEFQINQTLFRDCDLLRFPTSRQTSTKSFTEQASPIRFYNTIAYKIGDKTNKVNNDFYVSEITNIGSKEAFSQERETFCDQKGGGIQNVFKTAAPDKFYVTYTKTQLDTWKY